MSFDQDPIELTESRYINKQAVNRGLFFWSIGLGLLFFCALGGISIAYLRNFLPIGPSTDLALDPIPLSAPTLIPTAASELIVDDVAAEISDVTLQPTEIPATPIPSPTETPPPVDPSMVIESPLPAEILSLNTAYVIKADLSHPEGITNIQLLQNEQTVVSAPYVGQKEIRFEQQWVPLSDGRQTLQLVMTDGLGGRQFSESIEIRVIDEDFLARSQPVFERVQQEVFALRGLSLIDDIYPSVMGEGELRQMIRASGYSEEEARQDVLVLSSFRFTDPQYDLYEASIQYAGSGIGGFYSPETKDFVLVSIDKEINALEELVYAHELMHALQDQHFALGLFASESDPLGFEADLALRSLAEGEARLIEELYLNSDQFTDDQRVELFNVYQRLFRPRQFTLDPIPVLVTQFEFPYETGREFVDFILAAQGWEGLNRAWANPPQSTEHILHPDRYLAGDLPRDVSLNSLETGLGSDWTLIREDVFGEFYLREYLAQELDETSVDLAATGWGGDRYQVYNRTDSDEVVMMLRTAWDDGEEAGQFATAIQAFATAAYGDQFVEAYPGAVCRQADVVFCLIQLGGDWLMVQAPTPDLARLVLEIQTQ